MQGILIPRLRELHQKTEREM